MKTSELIDLALDWAVTSINNPDALRYGVADWREQRRSTTKNGEFLHRYHQSWSQGGPIIEREKLELEYYAENDEWRSQVMYIAPNGSVFVDTSKYGTTPLVAAMRCYVASKLGDEISIPKELL